MENNDELEGKKVRVIDPNYPDLLNQEFYLVGTRDYTLKDGKVFTWYQIHKNKDSMWGHYMGKHQIEFVD